MAKTDPTPCKHTHTYEPIKSLLFFRYDFDWLTRVCMFTWCRISLSRIFDPTRPDIRLMSQQKEQRRLSERGDHFCHLHIQIGASVQYVFQKQKAEFRYFCLGLSNGGKSLYKYLIGHVCLFLNRPFKALKLS